MYKSQFIIPLESLSLSPSVQSVTACRRPDCPDTTMRSCTHAGDGRSQHELSFCCHIKTIHKHLSQSAAHLKMCTVIIRFAKIHLHANCTKMRDLQKDSFSIFITNVPCLLPNQISKLCHGEGIALMMLQYYTSLPIVLLQTRTL